MSPRQEDLKPLTPTLAAVSFQQRRDAVTAAVVRIYDTTHGAQYWPHMTRQTRAVIVQFVIDQFNAGMTSALAHTSKEPDGTRVEHFLSLESLATALATDKASEAVS